MIASPKLNMKIRNTTPSWTTKERLLLAQAVYKIGDNNWVGVSRALKQHIIEESLHPAFSQKACATEYAKLLEGVETPKRKRNDYSLVEPPIVQITRRLYLEYLNILKESIAEDRKIYEKLVAEICDIKNQLDPSDHAEAAEAVSIPAQLFSTNVQAFHEREELRDQADLKTLESTSSATFPHHSTHENSHHAQNHLENYIPPSIVSSSSPSSNRRSASKSPSRAHQISKSENQPSHLKVSNKEEVSNSESIHLSPCNTPENQKNRLRGRGNSLVSSANPVSTRSKKKTFTSKSLEDSNQTPSGSFSRASSVQKDRIVSEPFKGWKKSILNLWRDISNHKCASIFMNPVTEEQAPGYHQIITNPICLHVIRKKIEDGSISSTEDFVADIMLMCDNALSFNKSGSDIHQMTLEFRNDVQVLINDFSEAENYLQPTHSTPSEAPALAPLPTPSKPEETPTDSIEPVEAPVAAPSLPDLDEGPNALKKKLKRKLDSSTLDDTPSTRRSRRISNHVSGPPTPSAELEETPSSRRTTRRTKSSTDKKLKP
eukprot:Sdes_comp19398_c0_seq1m10710